MKQRFILFYLVLLSVVQLFGQQRKEIFLTEGWQFTRNLSTWHDVRVPHDWAIAGPFDKKWDLQTVAIVQNGEKEATEKTGRSGALPWIGKGYYRNQINIPQGYNYAELVFDGAMSEPVVYFNGKEVIRWAYGYNAFRVDVSKLMKVGTNLLEVNLNNREESSRWYPGAGLYRPVRLILHKNKEEIIDEWSTFVYTSSIDTLKKSAVIKISCKTKDSYKKSGHKLVATVLNPKGQIVGQQKISNDGKSNDVCLENVHLWSPESPSLYTLQLTYTRKGTKLSPKNILDQTTTRFGVRTLSVSADGGFRLNGVSRKLKGVCLHHDLGPLGAAVNKAALIRQIKLMKEMGANAIRTAHNMPSTMQMQICDSLGMMVMAESFDMWIFPKNKNGYARFFKEWSDKDITNLLLNHRNHPSIIMWSIGNEIPEQGSKEGRNIAVHLQELCHQLDPSRPVTQGMDRAEAALKSGFAQVMDVPGFNYRVNKYANNLQQLPQGFLLGSETASTVSSRGVYKFPVEVSSHKTYSDGQCSGYDTEYCSWSNLPDDDWRWQDDEPRVIGEFVWTGFDYLGEPTPYDTYWPSRSSYFGICDLAGLPKDRYYLYRSKWNTREHTVHLLPHWTWPGREGQITPVYCYTDGVEAELFVNGQSQGRIRKNVNSRLDRYRLRWNNVVYQPGELIVVAYDANGQAIGTDTVRTAGAPHHLQLSSDKDTLMADGSDLAYITVSMVDKDGNVCPNAADQLSFAVEGCGEFEAVCNGDATSLESFRQPTMQLFHGKLVLTVRSKNKIGNIIVKVKDCNQKESMISLNSK